MYYYRKKAGIKAFRATQNVATILQAHIQIAFRYPLLIKNVFYCIYPGLLLLLCLLSKSRSWPSKLIWLCVSFHDFSILFSVSVIFSILLFFCSACGVIACILVFYGLAMVSITFGYILRCRRFFFLLSLCDSVKQHFEHFGHGILISIFGTEGWGWD